MGMGLRCYGYGIEILGMGLRCYGYGIEVLWV